MSRHHVYVRKNRRTGQWTGRCDCGWKVTGYRWRTVLTTGRMHLRMRAMTEAYLVWTTQ